jgi:hypothetical protein
VAATLRGWIRPGDAHRYQGCKQARRAIQDRIQGFLRQQLNKSRDDRCAADDTRAPIRNAPSRVEPQPIAESAREVSPEPLTEPDLNLSIHPARAPSEGCRLAPKPADSSRCRLTQMDPVASGLRPSLAGYYPASSLLRSSPSLTASSVLSASRFYRLYFFPYHRTVPFSFMFSISG